jgi:hypothetical protein
MGVDVKINADLLLKCRLEFPLQVINKLGNPAVVLVIFLAVADENVVFVSLGLSLPSGNEIIKFVFGHLQ